MTDKQIERIVGNLSRVGAKANSLLACLYKGYSTNGQTLFLIVYEKKDSLPAR